ncbi:MAG TPA: fibronectin type III domain-containing protein [Bacteroidales bacterium]
MKKKITVLLFALSILFGNNLVSQDLTQEVTGTVKQLSKYNQSGGSDQYGITATEYNSMVDVGRSYNAFDSYQTRAYIEWNLSFLNSVDNPVITSAKIDMFYMNALVPSGGNVYQGGSFLLEKPSSRISSFNADATTWNALKADTVFTRTVPSNFYNNWISSITGNTSLKKSTNPIVYKTFVEFITDLYKSGNQNLYLSLLNTNESSNGLIFVNTSTYPIKLTITYKNVPPSTPTNLSGNNVTSSGCTLSWNASAGAKLYNIYQDGNLIQTVSTTTATVTNLSAETTYSFTVSATNSAGESAQSNPISVITLPSPLDTPTGLAASNITCTGVSLSWNTVSGTVTGYKIYQNNSLAQTVSSDNTSIVLNWLTPGSNYTFSVSAFNDRVESSQSIGISVTTYTPPSAPQYLTARNIPQTGIVLTWTGASGQADGYNIYQSFTQLVGTTTNGYYVLGNLPPNTSYIYGVRAYNAYCESDIPGVGFLTPVSAPTSLTYSNVTSMGCDLAWSAPAEPVLGYRIYQNGSLIQTCTSTSASIINLAPSTAYTFKVTAYSNSEWESLSSNEVVVNTPALPAPSVPTNLSASNITNNSCVLSWTGSSGTVSGYYVYQNGIKIASVATTSTTFNSLSSGSTYTFTVSAYNSSAESDQSNPLVVTTTSLIPLAPTNLTAYNMIGSSCLLVWNASSGDVTGYNVYRNGTLIKTGVYAPQAIDLTLGVINSFTVSAYNTYGESTQSNVVSVNTAPSTAPSTPTGFNGHNTSGTSGSFSWNAPNSYVTGFYVYIYANCTALFLKVPVTSCNYSISGIHGAYCFYVSAYNSAGESPKSAAINMTFAPYGFSSLKSTDSNSEDELNITSNVSLKVHPNPVSDKLYVDGLLDFDATIFDLTGKKVLSVSKANESIDVSGLAPGIYIVKITGANGSLTERIVKQ